MKIEIYQDKRKEWRWRAVARNGKTVAEGGEGYKRRSALLKTLSKLSTSLLVAFTLNTIEAPRVSQ